MGELNNAPPRLSDLAPEDLRIVLRERHQANRDAWMQVHAAAGRTIWQRLSDWWRS